MKLVPYPPIGAKFPLNWIEIAKNPSIFIDQILLKNKSIVNLNITYNPKTYLLCSPEEIEYVLVKNNKNFCKGRSYKYLRLSLGNGLIVNEGESWLKQRRLMQPAFHKQMTTSFSIEIENIVKDLSERWKTLIENGNDIFNISDEMMKLSLKIALRLLFGTDIDDKEERVLFILNDINERTINKLKRPINLPFAIPTVSNIKFRKHLSELHQIIEEIINKRRSNVINVKNNDLLQILIDMTDLDSGEKMSEEQLKDEVMSLFIAGSETSATALGWTLYLLSNNESIYKKIQEEVDEISKMRLSSFENIHFLTKTNSAMKESLRIFPPVWIIVREAIEGDKIGDYHIEKGAQIYIPVKGLHNHPSYWKNPEIYSLERWENCEIPKFTYFPFGGGPRYCIGAELAQMEILLTLFELFKQFNFENLKKIIPEPLITLRPKDGLLMKVSLRNEN